MTSAAAGQFEIVHWDQGRLAVNCQFAGLFAANGMTTFDALFNRLPGEVVREVDNRVTTHVRLVGQTGELAFYLKRHWPPSLKQRLRPLLRGKRPLLGARHEWDAILRFHAVGLPTMTPVAFGQSRGRSLVMTQDLRAEQTLLDWVNESAAEPGSTRRASSAGLRGLQRRIENRVAAMARTMHECGMHHQDFYLNHLLCCGEIEDIDIRIIDLGRVRQLRRLSERWIIKDLAQLDFSARRLGCYDRLRFLRLYLGRPFRPEDRQLVRRIAAKSRRIASHTARHGL